MRSGAQKRLYRFLIPVLGLLFLIGSLNLTAAPPVALANQSELLEITGEGVTNPLTLTLADLEAMEQYEHVYSTINTWPTKRWYTARGVKLRDLLHMAGMKKEATLIRFVSTDDYEVTLTVKELLEDKRYYFPGLKENHPSDGSVPGSPDGAVEVEPILALVSVEGSDNPANMNDRDTLLFVLGQRAVTEQTNNLFLKYVCKIEVLTTEPERWDSPRANIPSGTVVPVGTRVELRNKHNNEDKIYYTTDGSTPTINSPMFNWSASRWWEQRDDVESVNKPIEVAEDTVIKMITIGPGKLDSEVVTFTFTADMTGKAVDPTKVPGGPPTGVTLDRNAINLRVGSTFQLEATVAPFNATEKDVTWRSSDTSVATVDNRGLVTVVGPGTAVITVTTVEGNHTAICVVNGPDDFRFELPAEPVEPEPQEPPEPPEAVEPEPEPEPDSTVSPDELQVFEQQVPEDRAQYLAEKEDLAVSAGDAAPGQPEAEGRQVFEMSADTVPLPLKVAEDRTEAYATAAFLFFFLSGAGIRYAEYTRER